MYINPFLAGVLATIGVEIVSIILWAIVYSGKGNDDNDETK